MGLDNNSDIRSALEHARTFTGTRNRDWTPFITAFNDLKIPDMPFCLVPVGSFQMGSDQHNNEKPIYVQSITEPYYIAQHPVTNAEWALGVKAGAVKVPEWEGLPEWYRDPAMADFPVVGMSWYEAKKFADWAGCRLPTELEWEYAARGVESLVYPWGNEWDSDNCIWAGNSGRQPASVGSKPEGKSWIGAVHLSGNVWEWMNSVSLYYPYKADDGRENFDSPHGRVLRGGSWLNTTSDYSRAANRDSDDPHNASSSIGFRLARS